ncbi:MAG: peptidoglycan -binding protein [Hyphomicrobiaceae bacterium]
MSYARGRKTASYTEFWPGFVDVLSTLLLVVTFLMSLFMVAQFYVGQEASGKDVALKRLTRQITELTNLLGLEQGKSKGAIDELAALQATLATLRAENSRLSGAAGLGEEKATAANQRIAALTKEIDTQKAISSEALSKVDLLNQQMLALRRQLAAIQEALTAAEAKDKESQARISDLGQRLNVALARQVQELQRYRSDFFGRLRELLRDRKDIRVVGDRFVFQSEVLFPSGQATLTPEGLAAIDQLATAIIELEKSIPKEIDWSLQVDGHTDSRPIASAQFPSNWELSTARAVTVVKYLISRGVAPNRVVAAGYGEFQPLEQGTSEEVLRRNRRIELKLTNR